MIAIIYTLLIRVLVKFKDENNLQLRRVKYKSLISPLTSVDESEEGQILLSESFFNFGLNLAHATAFHSERSSVENRTLQQR